MNESWINEALTTWGYSSLTDIQQKALALGVAAGESLVVSAPTSSGKTLVAELAILAAIHRGVRVLYLVSHRALADQKYLDFEKRFADVAAVALSTGDRVLGQADAQVRVATYEKAMGLVLSGQINLTNTLVVADEAQILCDSTRGPDIEAFCAVLRQRGVNQFLALTATVENPEDISGWMNCKLATSSERATPLHQEVWFRNNVYSLTFGRDIGITTSAPLNTNDLLRVVKHFLDFDRGPVLVFTETRRQAADLADDFTRSRPRTSDGIHLAEQLELYSEPTESTDKLKRHVESAVAFHTADLSSQERQVLETGFAKSQFDVCFATSTLAAGVNFPFRTIIFSTLTYQYRDPGERLSLSDYRNMSGRAGRLNLHPDGFAVLLPKNQFEKAYADVLVSPKNDVLKSVLLSLSLRKTLLSLVASRVVSTETSIDDFFENTLLWFQLLKGDAQKQAELKRKSREAMTWLTTNGLIEDVDGESRVTGLGKATAISGLLPETAVYWGRILRQHADVLKSDFDSVIDGLLYVVCGSPEYKAQKPSRFLPYVSNSAHGGLDFWSARKNLVALDSADPQLAQCARAMALYISGEAERKVAYSTGVPAGSLQRLAFDVAWVLEGLHRIATVPMFDLPQNVTNKISMLARQVRWGVPVNTIDLLRAAEHHRVPGLGRQRAMELVRSGLATLKDVAAAGSQKLTTILKNSIRAEALIASASAGDAPDGERLENAHIRVAANFHLESVVARCYKETGTGYERAIQSLIEAEPNIKLTVLDDGIRQNVPEFLLEIGSSKLLMECKTKIKLTALVDKGEAWAVMQKSADFDQTFKRVTIGKPGFDESSKQKVAAAADISLVEHSAFVEAFLRLMQKQITPEVFAAWLGTPGLAELERLQGSGTYLA